MVLFHWVQPVDTVDTISPIVGTVVPGATKVGQEATGGSGMCQGMCQDWWWLVMFGDVFISFYPDRCVFQCYLLTRNDFPHLKGALEWNEQIQKRESTPKPKKFWTTRDQFSQNVDVKTCIHNHAYIFVIYLGALVSNRCKAHYFTWTKIVSSRLVDPMEDLRRSSDVWGEPELQELLEETPPYVNPANMDTAGVTENSGAKKNLGCQRANDHMNGCSHSFWGIRDLSILAGRDIKLYAHVADSWSNNDFVWPQNSRISRKVPRGEWNHEVPIIDSLVLFRYCEGSLNLRTPKR